MQAFQITTLMHYSGSRDLIEYATFKEINYKVNEIIFSYILQMLEKYYLAKSPSEVAFIAFY